MRVLGEPAGSPSLRSEGGVRDPGAVGLLRSDARENLRFFARILGAPPESIDAAIATVRLGEFENRIVRDMSGGQRARVSLATALLGDPDVLVLDEPTVGLDPLLRHDLWETFKALAAQGKTLLVSSHVMDEAANCDRLAR